MKLNVKLRDRGIKKLHRRSDRRLSAKLVPTFAGRGCHMVSVTDPYGRILGFLDRETEEYISKFGRSVEHIANTRVVRKIRLPMIFHNEKHVYWHRIIHFWKA
jgi:hypothetical protein